MPLGKGYMCIGMLEYPKGCTVMDCCKSVVGVSLDACSSGSGDGLFGISGGVSGGWRQGKSDGCTYLGRPGGRSSEGSKLMILSGAASCPAKRESRCLDNKVLEASLSRG